MRAIVRSAIVVYATAAFAALIVAIAIQAAFFAHEAPRFGYTTPVRQSDIITIAASFRVRDVLDAGSFYPLAAFLAVATYALLLLPRRVVPLPLRLVLTVPQLLYLPWMLLAPDAVLGDFAAYAAARLDGEWLHEAWPLTEAIGFWMPVPLIIAITQAASVPAIE